MFARFFFSLYALHSAARGLSVLRFAVSFGSCPACFRLGVSVRLRSSTPHDNITFVCLQTFVIAGAHPGVGGFSPLLPLDPPAKAPPFVSLCCLRVSSARLPSRCFTRLLLLFSALLGSHCFTRFLLLISTLLGLSFLCLLLGLDKKKS